MELASWIYPGIRPYVYEGGCDGSGLVIKTCFFKTLRQVSEFIDWEISISHEISRGVNKVCYTQISRL